MSGCFNNILILSYYGEDEMLKEIMKIRGDLKIFLLSLFDQDAYLQKRGGVKKIKGHPSDKFYKIYIGRNKFASYPSKTFSNKDKIIKIIFWTNFD